MVDEAHRHQPTVKPLSHAVSFVESANLGGGVLVFILDGSSPKLGITFPVTLCRSACYGMAPSSREVRTA
jgi:hypothetical protein